MHMAHAKGLSCIGGIRSHLRDIGLKVASQIPHGRLILQHASSVTSSHAEPVYIELRGVVVDADLEVHR